MWLCHKCGHNNGMVCRHTKTRNDRSYTQHIGWSESILIESTLRCTQRSCTKKSMRFDFVYSVYETAWRSSLRSVHLLVSFATSLTFSHTRDTVSIWKLTQNVSASSSNIFDMRVTVWCLIYKRKTIFCFSALQYMQLFRKGSTVFNYFMHKKLLYSAKNALRIMGTLHPDDLDRYQYDTENCDWDKLVEYCLLGIRRYYFRESYETTMWHRVMYKL